MIHIDHIDPTQGKVRSQEILEYEITVQTEKLLEELQLIDQRALKEDQFAKTMRDHPLREL
jgi:hypothetical protein